MTSNFYSSGRCEQQAYILPSDRAVLGLLGLMKLRGERHRLCVVCGHYTPHGDTTTALWSCPDCSGVVTFDPEQVRLCRYKYQIAQEAVYD